MSTRKKGTAKDAKGEKKQSTEDTEDTEGTEMNQQRILSVFFVSSVLS
jgi:hypothetical protein